MGGSVVTDIHEKFRDFCKRHGGKVAFWRLEHPSEIYPEGYCRGVDFNSIDPSEVVDLLDGMRRSLKEEGYVGIRISVEGAYRIEGFLIDITQKKGGGTQEKIKLSYGTLEGGQAKKIAERIIEEVGRRANLMRINIIGDY